MWWHASQPAAATFTRAQLVLAAAVAGMSPIERRGSAYGVFNTIFGVFWFVGSLTMGILYDISIPYLVIFSMAAQLASVPLFFLIRKSG